MARALLTASEIFPAMEQLLLSTKQELELSLHIFSPRTKTRSSEAHQKGLQDWSDILVFLAGKGVRIRLLLNDFDPIGATELHANAWERVQMLNEAFIEANDRIEKTPEILLVSPGGQSGAVIRTLVWPFVRRLAKKRLKDFAETGRRVPPGLKLWAKTGVPIWPPICNFTQAFHQKFMVSDGVKAIIGGLDVDERRYDDPKHDRQSEETWHDVSVEIEGGAAKELSSHFKDCWQLAKEQGVSQSLSLTDEVEPGGLNFIVPKSSRTVRIRKPAYDGRGNIETTIALPNRSPISFGPNPWVRGLEDAHIELINSAENFIYIETQFLRAKTIREALLSELARKPNLHVILLLPAAPEEVAYQGSKNPIHRYGEWLQARALEMLMKQAPNRFAAFCLVTGRPRDEHYERDALDNKSTVYVHSKVMIADDERSIVSSANLNSRSLEWDIEAGYISRCAEFSASLRKRLWHVHLGNSASEFEDISKPADLMQLWKKQADNQLNGTGQSMKKSVVNFPFEQAKRFSKRHIFIPRQMV